MQQSYEAELLSIKNKLLESHLAMQSAMTQFNALVARISFDETQERLGIKPEPSKVLETVKVKVVEPTPVVEPVKEELVINDEWKAALELLNNGDENVFLTGGAGAGKSTLLNHFVDHYDGNVAIVAPTGVAALRVGGETIHRFFGLGASAKEKGDMPILKDTRQEKYKKLDVLIMDEASMIRADLMDAVDEFLRKNGRSATKPFGGCKVVLVGDLYQLPPVSKDKNEQKWLMQRYGVEAPYFFHAEAWRDNPVKIINLTTIFRQKDPEFTAALNAIRIGEVKPEHMKLINSRFDPFKKLPDWLTLCTSNALADETNQKMIRGLPDPSKTFEADVTGDFDLKNSPTDEILTLKVGAQVMFIRNNPGKWVNGTRGKVVKLEPLTVEVDGLEHEVETAKWENTTYELDEKKKKLIKNVKGTFTQIPLKLAAAITIHKSQGLTLDQGVIDLGSGAFAGGMTYVAISRFRALDGFVLRKQLQDRDLIVSDEVVKFMRGQPIAKPQPLQPSFLFGEPSEIKSVEPKLTADDFDKALEAAKHAFSNDIPVDPNWNTKTPDEPNPVSDVTKLF